MLVNVAFAMNFVLLALLWLRNLASTATSQFVDTLIFITIAVSLFQGLPPGQVLGLVVGQYAVKLLIALLDTPFVYAVVGFVRSRGPGAVDSELAADR